MQIVSEEGTMQPGTSGGGNQGGNLGDYVMSQRASDDPRDCRAKTTVSPEGFDDVLERLMQATGPQGPIPAADVVVEGLPRLMFTEDSLGMFLDPKLSLLILC